MRKEIQPDLNSRIAATKVESVAFTTALAAADSLSADEIRFIGIVAQTDPEQLKQKTPGDGQLLDPNEYYIPENGLADLLDKRHKKYMEIDWEGRRYTDKVEDLINYAKKVDVERLAGEFGPGFKKVGFNLLSAKTVGTLRPDTTIHFKAYKDSVINTLKAFCDGTCPVINGQTYISYTAFKKFNQ